MGLFDFFKRKTGAAPMDGLREDLFEAIEADDRARLADLCAEHHDAIVRAFAGWKVVPPAVRGDPAALRRYGRCLPALADFFAAARGEPGLIRQLFGPDDSGPVDGWQAALRQAETRMGEGRFGDAVPHLEDLARKIQAFQDVDGTIAGSFLARASGDLGYCRFQTGRAAEAVEPLTQSLDFCRRQADAGGTLARLTDLFEAHRYLGQPEPAAGYADRLADTLAEQGDATQAAWFRRQASVVRAGEPLVRLVGEANGRRFELDDPGIPEGVFVQFVFYRNRPDMEPTLRHLTRAEAHWGQDRVEEAVAELVSATQADPFAPQPYYQLGVLALYAAGYAEAAACFRKANELAPGWFHCRRYHWLAGQLAGGRLGHDTFLTLQALDGGREDRTPAAKVEMAREALGRTPDLAWLYLCLGGYLKELGQERDAERAFRDGLEHAGEPDVRCCLMLEQAILLDPTAPERRRLLDAVRQLNGNLMATATAGVLLRLSG